MVEQRPERCDAVVIGAGPGGSTCARELARQGLSVILLERTGFPRFHVGESMIPYMAGLLDRLGLLDTVAEVDYPRKVGAEFTSDTGAFRRVSFKNQGSGRRHETFQVERAHFDDLLLSCARQAGVVVRHGARVDEVVVESGRVVGVRYRSEGERSEIRSRFVIDASGRAGIVVRQFGLRRTIDKLRMVAVYRHFGNLDERCNPGWEGDIQIGNHPEGWVWAIPIWRDTMSVGTVMPRHVFRTRASQELFDDHRHRIPRIVARMRGTSPVGELRVETDYCYFSDQVAGPGWFAVGDAGCFVDPIFSGGVYLAMATGNRAAEVVTDLVRSGASEAAGQYRFSAFYKTGYDTYSRLIQAFYEFNFNFSSYRASLPKEIGNRDISLVLSGDFWSDGNRFADILRSERRWTTFAPFDQAFGCPVYPELAGVSGEPLVTSHTTGGPTGPGGGTTATATGG
ncbi:MAG: NAD(P)/FAD-dependent oxidoreductase [Natronosporangium sp.]